MTEKYQPSKVRNRCPNCVISQCKNCAGIWFREGRGHVECDCDDNFHRQQEESWNQRAVVDVELPDNF